MVGDGGRLSGGEWMWMKGRGSDGREKKMLFFYILYKNIFIFLPSHSYLIPTTFSSCPPMQRRRRAAGEEGEVGRGGDELEEEEEW